MVKSRLEDAIFLEKAKLAIGEYNLKMNADFSLTRKKETAAIKYKQLIDCRKKVQFIRDSIEIVIIFNIITFYSFTICERILIQN